MVCIGTSTEVERLATESGKFVHGNVAQFQFQSRSCITEQEVKDDQALHLDPRLAQDELFN